MNSLSCTHILSATRLKDLIGVFLNMSCESHWHFLNMSCDLEIVVKIIENTSNSFNLIYNIIL